MTSRDLAKMIEHSLLHPTLTEQQLIEGCEIAKQYDVANCCIKPCHVTLATQVLRGSGVAVCAVIGFPHGNSTVPIKVAEAEQVIRDGATEVDMVINISKALESDWQYLEEEIGAVRNACTKGGAILKVIFETDYLNDDQIIMLCQICSRVGAAFVKTSTGYNYVKQPDGSLDYAGATDHVLRVMRKYSAPEVQVKAAGKVRGVEGFQRVRALGATRVGTAQTATVVEEARVKLDGA
jgi:deoxyribose-phosphate aldolase